MQSSPYPALTNYAICIKRHQTSLASYCGITFAAATQGDGKYVVWSLYVEIVSIYIRASINYSKYCMITFAWQITYIKEMVTSLRIYMKG